MIARPHRMPLIALVLVSALTGCASAPRGEGAPTPEDYRNVVGSPIRTDQDRRLDAARHPAEFLAFAQARPGMQVLDVSAAAGYTSQLLALAVGPTGKVFAQNPSERPALSERLAEHPQANLVPVLRPFDDPVPEQAPKLDLITIVQNYHDICNLPVDRAAMNAHLFAALKRGGHLVVTDHSARSGTGLAETKRLHRIDEAVVRAEFERAGFVLEAEGDFLRNPADSRDGVSYSSKIPTDKFALRFVKK